MILYTGFKGKHNSSCRLMDFFEGEKLLLTNSFAGLERDINSVSPDYEAVFMFGLDKSLTDSVRIETVSALNGRTPHTSLNSATARKCFEAEKILCTVSERPAGYLCNAAYFHALNKFGGRAMFFHVPPFRYLDDNMSQSIVRAVKQYSNRSNIL